MLHSAIVLNADTFNGFFFGNGVRKNRNYKRFLVTPGTNIVIFAFAQ